MNTMHHDYMQHFSARWCIAWKSFHSLQSLPEKLLCTSIVLEYSEHDLIHVCAASNHVQRTHQECTKAIPMNFLLQLDLVAAQNKGGKR